MKSVPHHPPAAEPTTDNQPLTERQAAALLAVSVRTLQGWRRRRQGPPYMRLGRTVRYNLIKLMAWAEACEVLPS